ncbi:hypothetical protein ACOMHN_040966 [Nucella lapillus]
MPPKSKLARAGTMKTTAKDAVAYLYPENKRSLDYLESTTVENLTSMGVAVPDTSSGAAQGSTVGPSKGKKGAGGKSALKRDSTMAKTVAEAKRLLGGEVTVTEGRRTRPRKKAAPAQKPALKRAGTMQNTAKEGNTFLKRTKGKKGKGKK